MNTKASAAFPDTTTTAVVSARGRRRVESGHPWVFRPDVAQGPSQDVLTGGPALVRVLDDRGHDLGLAMWSLRSPVALRMLERHRATGATSRRRPAEVPELMTLVVKRVEQALAHRRAVGYLDRSAFRVVHAEGDDLPGLFIDKYEHAAVVQIAATALEPLLPQITQLVVQTLGVKLVFARNDSSMRDFEGLPRNDHALFGQGDSTITYRLGPNQLQADLLRDGKTGGFLDQADNHAFVASLSAQGGRALDAFTFHGGFALALARRSAHVLAADADLEASRRARANAELNGLRNMEVRCVDAYQLLANLEASGQTFDTVVLDPPAFAKRAGAVVAAQRAYHELIVRGLRVAAPGALVVACSCSGQVDPALWDRLVAEAAATAGRSVQVLARRGAGLDHPERLGVSETGHLKCWVLRAL